jgi:hypothetical protein
MRRIKIVTSLVFLLLSSPGLRSYDQEPLGRSRPAVTVADIVKSAKPRLFPFRHVVKDLRQGDIGNEKEILSFYPDDVATPAGGSNQE